jgi:hypothetical protein
MRPILLAAAVIFLASANLRATEGLNFFGGGYRVEVVVGFADEATVGSVRLTRPGAKEWVTLPHELVRVEEFDMKKQILILHFSKGNDPDPELPRSLSLTVKKENGVLLINGKKIKGELNWGL